MPWNKVVSRALSKWMEAEGQHSDIVISTRVRLARNIEGMPFPHLLSEAKAAQVIDAVEAAVAEINLMGIGSKVELYRLDQAQPLERYILVEKHLLSPQQAQDARGKAVAISGDEAVSIMVNEEDHLRIQCLFPGLQLDEAWSLANRIDDAIEQKIHYAFHQQRGYLTVCPTNVGTGLRASVMMHLPALVMGNQAGKVLTTLSQMRGIVVRGLYGEGSEAVGNIFQISIQTSLGPTEEEIIANLKAVALEIIGHEQRARDMLMQEMKLQLEDQVWRSFGLLTTARMMTSDEAMRHLSKVRLGADLQLIPGLDQRMLNELLVAIRPAYLQKVAGRELSPPERDVRRATQIRQQLAGGRQRT